MRIAASQADADERGCDCDDRSSRHGQRVKPTKAWWLAPSARTT